MSPLGLAWVAGLFEGEGNVDACKKKRPRLRLKLTDLDVIVRLHELAGGTLYGPYNNGLKKDGTPCKMFWVWHSPAAEARELAQKLLPFMGARRRKKMKEAFVL